MHVGIGDQDFIYVVFDEMTIFQGVVALSLFILLEFYMVGL
jgi:hypothetical protein